MPPRVQRGVFALALLLITVLLYAPMFTHWHLTGDFAPHSVYMERMIAGDPQVFIELPNTLYHGSVILPSLLTPQTAFRDWIVPVCVAWMVLLALLIWWQIRAALYGRETGPTVLSLRGEMLALLLTVLMLVIAPIFLLTPDNQYFGYMTPYVYHNPTMIPLRPIAFLLFVGAVSLASAEVATIKFFERRRELHMPLLAALTVASILAKPNFVMILVPALVIWLVILRLMRRHVEATTILMGIVIPGLVFLGYQSTSYSGSGMAFRPFYTQEVWAINYDPQSSANLGLKILLSLAFPLTVSGLYARRAVQSPMLILAWIAAVGGVALTYFFYDTIETPAGNLTWSGQMGAFILHLAALLFLLRQHPWLTAGRPRDGLRLALCGAVLLLHVISGVLWYQAHLIGVWPDVIYSLW